MNDFSIEPEAAEHAYLIAREVRPLAIVGHCVADASTMLAIAAELERVAVGSAIPFVAPREDGVADYGFATYRWAIDLLRWAQTDAVPVEQRHRIIGLLLGYSPHAIHRFEEQTCGRMFTEP